MRVPRCQADPGYLCVLLWTAAQDPIQKYGPHGLLQGVGQAVVLGR